MSVIELFPSIYCLCVKNHKGEEEIFLQQDIAPNSERYRLDLFEDEMSLYRWLEEEQARQVQNEWWHTYKMLGKLYAKKMTIKELQRLIRERENIDSVTFITKNGVRRLYFRGDFAYEEDLFSIPGQKLYAKEPLYIIYRQREINEQIILLKEAYFITYPEIATPLFSLGMREWAEELIGRKPNQGYYIEQTTLYDIYTRIKLKPKDSELFIFSSEEEPHYILSKTDLEKIVEGTLDYR